MSNSIDSIIETLSVETNLLTVAAVFPRGGLIPQH